MTRPIPARSSLLPRRGASRLTTLAAILALTGLFLLSLFAASSGPDAAPLREASPPPGAASAPAPHVSTQVRYNVHSEGPLRGPAASAAPAVVHTLNLVTNQLFPGNHQPAVQDSPNFALFDPNNGRLYVRGDIGETISVVDPSTGAVISNIPGQADQLAYALLPTLALDPGTGLLYAPNYNEGNVSIIDPTTNSVVGSIPVFDGPYGITFDPDNGNFYVAGYLGNNVTVFSGTTDRTVANISVGTHPTDILYDPVNQEIYVANYFTHNVSAINTTQEKVVANLPVGNYPSDLALDPADDLIDVPASNGGGSSNVTILDGSNDTVRSVVAVGSDASSLAWAPSAGRMFVANGGSNNVSVIAQPSDQVVKTLPIGHGSNSIVFDPVNGLVYSANYGSLNVSVLIASKDKVVGALPDPNFPQWSTVDPATGEVYVVNTGTSYTESNLTVLANATLATPINAIPLGMYPVGLAYDPDMMSLFGGDSGGRATYEVGPGGDLRTALGPAGLYPKHVTYDSVNHDVYVLNQGSDNVTVLSSNLTPVASIGVGIGPTGITFDASNGFVYVSDDYGGNVTVINGSSNHVKAVITVKPFDDLTTVFYDPHSTHVYVADASGENVSVIDGTSDTLIGSIPVGSQPDSIALDSLNDTLFVANSGGGNLSVINDTSDTPLRSVAVYSAGLIAYDAGRDMIFDANLYSPAVYAVNASNYTVWGGEIYLGGAQAPSGIAYDAASQEVVVATEYDGSLSFLGTPTTTYPVTFEESGLPMGTPWSIVLGGISNGSTTMDIGFRMANGSALFSVGSTPGYTANRSAGTVTVVGLPVVVMLAFTANAVLGNADFTETGLVQGTEWNVTYNGVEQSSLGPTIDFTEAAGSYAFSVPDVGGYVPSPSSGHLTVLASATVSQPIVFTLGSNPPPTLTVSLVSDPATLALGGSTVLTANAGGGVPPYTYQYSALPTGCASVNASRLTCQPTVAGDFNITVTVTDPAGASAHNHTAIQIGKASSTPPGGSSSTSNSPSGLPGWAWWAVLLIAVLALVAGLLAYRRRRKDRPAAPPGPMATPPPPAAPPPPPPPS